MNDETRNLIKKFAQENIAKFHATRLAKITNLKLKDILAKNPYLFRAKNLNRADELISAILDASLSSGEETSFGKFLEDLAIYTAEQSGGGAKSVGTGLDLELTRGGVRYLVAIKSGQKWGNKSQHDQLRIKFSTGAKVLRQSKYTGPIQFVEGICYGKFPGKESGRQDRGHYIRLIGQSFWQLLSGDSQLYIDLIEAIGHEQDTHASQFEKEKDVTFKRLVREFTDEFCASDGNIDWLKLVRFVSETEPSNVQEAQSVLPGYEDAAYEEWDTLPTQSDDDSENSS